MHVLVPVHVQRYDQTHSAELFDAADPATGSKGSGTDSCWSRNGFLLERVITGASIDNVDDMETPDDRVEVVDLPAVT